MSAGLWLICCTQKEQLSVRYALGHDFDVVETNIMDEDVIKTVLTSRRGMNYGHNFRPLIDFSGSR
jgi:hypothetical protein